MNEKHLLAVFTTPICIVSILMHAIYFVCVCKDKKFRKIEMAYAHGITLVTFVNCIQHACTIWILFLNGIFNGNIACWFFQTTWLTYQFCLAYLHVFLSVFRFMAAHRLAVYRKLKNSITKVYGSIGVLAFVAIWFSIFVKYTCGLSSFNCKFFCYDTDSESKANVLCYALSNLVIVLIIPIVVTFVCYCLVIGKINRSGTRVNKTSYQRFFRTKKEQKRYKKRSNQLSLATNLFIVCSAYMSLVLNMIVIFLSYQKLRNFYVIPVIHVLAIFLQSLNPAVFFYDYVKRKNSKNSTGANMIRQAKTEIVEKIKKYYLSSRSNAFDEVELSSRKLYTIQENDTMLSLKHSQWLTNIQIYRFFKLLKAQYPCISGLFDPNPFELQKFGKAYSKQDKIVFVCNIDDCHWATVSNLNFPDNTWNIYDSLKYEKEYFTHIFKQLLPDNDFVFLNFMNVKSQNGHTDCGLFALAYATALCNQKDPCNMEFKQNELTNHYNMCVQQGHSTLFPWHPIQTVSKIYKHGCLVLNSSL
jgi:hypothetical protein